MVVISGKSENKGSYAEFIYPNEVFDADWRTNLTVVDSSVTPEPTSGLLMLLGIAGLALRRKRA